MTDRGIALVGMAIGAVIMATSGLFDAYTRILLICGTVILSSGILAASLSGRK